MTVLTAPTPPLTALIELTLARLTARTAARLDAVVEAAAVEAGLIVGPGPDPLVITTEGAVREGVLAAIEVALPGLLTADARLTIADEATARIATTARVAARTRHARIITD